MFCERYQIELAMWGVRLLPIIALVAVGSFAAKSRIAFLLGTAGAFVGLLAPQPVIYAQYRSVEAAYMGSLTDSADHMLFYGIIGAMFGYGFGVYLSMKRRALARETNLRREASQQQSERLLPETRGGE